MTVPESSPGAGPASARSPVLPDRVGSTCRSPLHYPRTGHATTSELSTSFHDELDPATSTL